MPIIFDNTPAWAQAMGAFVPAFNQQQQLGVENNFKQQGLNQNLMDLQSLIQTREAGTKIAQERTDIDRTQAGYEGDRLDLARRGQQFGEAEAIARRQTAQNVYAKTQADKERQIRGMYDSAIDIVRGSHDVTGNVPLISALVTGRMSATDPDQASKDVAAILELHKAKEHQFLTDYLAEQVAGAKEAGGMDPRIADAIQNKLRMGDIAGADADMKANDERQANKHAQQSAIETYGGQFQVMRPGMNPKQASDTWGALQRLSTVNPNDKAALDDAMKQVSTAMSGHYGIALGKIMPDMNGWGAGGDIPPDAVMSEMTGIAMQAHPRNQFVKSVFDPANPLVAVKQFDEENWRDAVNQTYQNIAKTAHWANPGMPFPPQTTGGQTQQGTPSPGIQKAVGAIMQLKQSGTYTRERAAELLKQAGVDDHDPQWIAAIQQALGGK